MFDFQRSVNWSRSQQFLVKSNWMLLHRHCLDNCGSFVLQCKASCLNTCILSKMLCRKTFQCESRHHIQNMETSRECIFVCVVFSLPFHWYWRELDAFNLNNYYSGFAKFPVVLIFFIVVVFVVIVDFDAVASIRAHSCIKFIFSLMLVLML